MGVGFPYQVSGNKLFITSVHDGEVFDDDEENGDLKVLSECSYELDI